MAKHCERIGCPAVSEIRIMWLTSSEESRQLWAEIDGRDPSSHPSLFFGCRVHAREVWCAVHGQPRSYREVAR